MRPRAAARAALAALALAGALLVVGCGGASDDAAETALLSDGHAVDLLEVLRDGEGSVLDEALTRIESVPDRRFVAPLIELVRASQMGIAARGDYNRRIVALERLSGQSLGGDWFSWAEWYAGTELEAPPGFTTWKGRLLAGLDPQYTQILRDDHPRTIRAAEIDWGGVPVDGIPPLESPRFVSAAEGDAGLLRDEPVFGIVLNGDARAYPLRILDWHEVVNDTVGGVPVSIAYCALCGSGIAYDGRLRDGDEGTTFGTSGLVYRSNKLLIDRATGTLWNQLTGRAALGPLAGEGLQLRVHPLVLTPWQDWQRKHPDTTVLSLDTGFERNYSPGQPYGGYFQSPEKLFPARMTRDERREKDRVYGVVVDGTARAWDLDHLVEAGVLQDAIGDVALTLLAGRGRIQVEGHQDAVTPVSYDAGAEIRSYRTGALRLERRDGALVDAEGARWEEQEDALVGPDGSRAERVPGTLVYWFAWQAFHPKTEFGSGERREDTLEDSG